MARLPRIVAPGCTLHILQRGINRQAIFLSLEDYAHYLECLRRASERVDCDIHAYVLMTNHVHLLLTPKTTMGPSRMMQVIGRSYVRYINEAYNRTGTLWDGRYKSALIDSSHYLLPCCRYIELNPVRAGIVSRPEQYRWSSYCGNALFEMNTLVTPHELYDQLGNTKLTRAAAYRVLFDSQPDQTVIDMIRGATEAGNVIGGKSFKNEIKTILKRRISKFNHGGDRKSKVFRQEQCRRDS